MSSSRKRKSDVSDLKAGDYLSRKQYLKVEKVGESEIHFETETGFRFYASNTIVEDSMWTAHQFTNTVKVSATELAQKLMESAGDVFTVNFKKQATEKTVLANLEKASIQDLTDAKRRKLLAKSLKVGEERTLVGYLVATEPVLGRSKVIDLEVGEGYAMRLVDHRSLNWLILNGVKYTL